MLNPAQDSVQRVDQPDRHEYRPLGSFILTPFTRRLPQSEGQIVERLHEKSFDKPDGQRNNYGG